MLLMRLLKNPKYQVLFWFIGIVGIEIISRLTVFHPVARAAATVLAGGGFALIAMRAPSLGLAILCAELAIGSKGALTKIPLGWEVDGGTSLRIVLVGSFLAGWFVQAVRFWRGRMSELRFQAKSLVRERLPWIALGALCVWAGGWGLVLQNPAFVGDANAWAFLILLIPVVDVAARDGGQLIHHGSRAAVAALLWLPVKTIGLLYIFSHGIGNPQATYLWVRRTGVGEVTLVTGNLFRIFIQSQVYAAAGLFISIAGLWENAQKLPIGKNCARLLRFVALGSAISLLISLSRSIWIGAFAGAVCLFFLAFHKTVANKKLQIGQILLAAWSMGWRFAVALIASLTVIAATVWFPIPRVDVGSLTALFGSRGSTTDAAAESRWSLLPVLVDKIKERPILGSGFGASVTYKTQDPRLLAQYPDGMYTTHAFEWGWVEHWIKFGILGIPVMGWLLISLIRRLWRTDAPWWIRAAFVSSLVAFGALHVFTPYLNHPLGFGFLLAAEAYITQRSSRTARHQQE